MDTKSKVIPREQADAIGPDGGAGLFRALMQSPDERMRQLFGEAETSGYRAGSDQGRRDFLQATAEAVKAVREQFFSVEQALGPLVMLATEKILGTAPPAEVARQALSAAIGEVVSGVAVTLRVAPDDLDFMRAVWAGLAAERSDLSGAIEAIEGDAGLQPGEMLLETLKGRTHIGVPYQLARLRYGVLGSSR